MSTILLFSLVFLSVSAGLTASYYAVSSFWSRESSRIRQRIVEEFARDEEKAPRFTLFKNPEQMQLEGTAAPAEGAALPVPARQSWWRRLREEIEVAGLKVKVVTPWFDGALLDNIVDFITYAFAPMLLLWANGYLPGGRLGGAIAAIPVLASCYQFCRSDAKTDDHFFMGFPSYWNIVAFYSIVLDLGTAEVTTIVFSSCAEARSNRA